MALTTIGLVLGGLSSAQQLFAGIKASKRAGEKLEEFDFQDLETGAFDDVKPSLELEQQQLANIQQQRERIADVAMGLGGAEAMSLLSQTEGQLSQAEQQLFGRMAQADMQVDILKGQDLQKRRDLKQQIDTFTLQSLLQEKAAGEQMIGSSLSGMANLAVSAGLAQEYTDAATGAATSGGDFNNFLSPELKKSLMDRGIDLDSEEGKTFFGKLLQSVGGLFKKKED